MALLKGLSYDDLDGGTDDQKGYRSLMHGPEPGVHVYDNYQDEVAFITDRIRAMQEEDIPLKSVCIVARRKDSVEDYLKELADAGIPTFKISRNHTEDAAQPGVRVATMHRVKGLEFDHVIVAG